MQCLISERFWGSPPPQVSGSMDKNLKIWGMTFGECRKSIFAHDDSGQ